MLLLITTKDPMQTGWTDVRIKSSQFFLNSSPKSKSNIFWLCVKENLFPRLFKKAQNGETETSLHEKIFFDSMLTFQDI